MRAVYGRGVHRSKRDGSMGSLEKKFAEYLDAEKAAGRIVEWFFEPCSLKLAQGSRYVPDFLVLMPDLELRFVEVKGGYWEANSKTKLKVAASLFPFRFQVARAKLKRDGGGWTFEEMNPPTGMTVTAR